MRRLPYLLLFLSVPAYSQMPMVGDYAAVPDNWLLGSGQRWHYHTDAAKRSQEIAVREPVGDEVSVVDRAKKILNNLLPINVQMDTKLYTLQDKINFYATYKKLVTSYDIVEDNEDISSFLASTRSLRHIRHVTVVLE